MPSAAAVERVFVGLVSQALKALETARKALDACSEDLSVLDSKRDQASQPFRLERSRAALLVTSQGRGVEETRDSARGV